MLDALNHFLFTLPFWAVYGGVTLIGWRLVAGHLAYTYPHKVKRLRLPRSAVPQATEGQSWAWCGGLTASTAT